MSETAILEKIETLSQAVTRLQERVEDLEDLRDLEEAIAENAGKPLLPWEQVKAELDRD
jgi:cell division protein FtsB